MKYLLTILLSVLLINTCLALSNESDFNNAVDNTSTQEQEASTNIIPQNKPYHMTPGVPVVTYKKGVAAYDSGDFDSAFKYFSAAAEMGLSEAKYNLGLMYMNGIGCKKDLNNSILWLRQAVDSGIVSAKLFLGEALYLSGKYDCSEVIKLLEDSYAIPYKPKDAAYFLGLIYDNKTCPVADNQLAMDWLNKAADAGSVDAAYHLAFMLYSKGDTQSKIEALKWYQTAASGGIVEAKYNVGVMYLNGEGTEKNLEKAKQYLGEASNAGSIKATKILNKIENTK